MNEFRVKLSDGRTLRIEASSPEDAQAEAQRFLDSEGGMDAPRASESADAYQSPGNMGFGNRADRETITPRQQALADEVSRLTYGARQEDKRSIDDTLAVQEDILRNLDGPADPEARMRVEERARSSRLNNTANAQRGAAALVSGIGDTTSYGFGDELSGDREAARGVMDARRALSPGAFLTGQFAGALASPGGPVATGATRAINAGRMALNAGVQSAIYGFGSGEGTQDRIQSGITSAAVGGLLGAGLGALVPGTRAVTPRQPPTASAQKPMTQGQEAVLAAERLGTTMPRFAASDNWIVRNAGAGLAASPVAGGRVAASVERMNEGAGNAVQRLAETAGAVRGRPAVTGFNQAGIVVQKGLEGTAKKNEQTVDRLYANVRKLAADAGNPGSTLPATREVFQELKDRLSRIGEDSSQGVSEVAGAIRKVTEGATIGIGDLIFLRNKVGNLFKDGDATGEVKQLFGALSDDIKSLADSAGKPVREAWSKANAVYKTFQKRKEALEPVAGASRASLAMQRIESMMKEGKSTLDPRELAVIRRSVQPDDWKKVESAVLGRLGTLDDGTFSVSLAGRQIAQMDKQSRKVLFSKEAQQALTDLEAVASQFKKSADLYNRSNTTRSAAVVGGLTAGGAGAIADLGATLQAGLGIAGVTFPAAVVLSRPATSRAFKQWASVKAAQMRPARASRVRVNPRSVRRASYALATELARQYDLTTKQAQALAESLANGGKAAYAEGEQQR